MQLHPFLLSLVTLPLMAVLSCGGGSVSINNNGRRCLDQKPQAGDVIRAVVADQFDCLKDLVQSGANVNETIPSDNGPITPLMTAIVLQRKEIGHYLLERGASTSPMYKGFRAKDFAFHLLGDSDAFTRLLRRQTKR